MWGFGLGNSDSENGDDNDITDSALNSGSVESSIVAWWNSSVCRINETYKRWNKRTK